MTDERETLLIDALRALEAIFDASYRDEPFTTAEMATDDFVLGILARADYLKIRFAESDGVPAAESATAPRPPRIYPGEFAE